MKRTLLLLLAAFLLATPAAAQRLLTLEEAIELAREQSPAAAIARQTYEAAEWSDRAAGAAFMPQVSLSARGPGLDRAIDEIQQDDGSFRYVPSSRMYSSFNVNVSQSLPFTGGELFLSSGLNRIDQFGNRSTSLWQSSPMIVGLVQPLFAFNELKWERREQPVRFELARRTYAEDLAEVAVTTAQAFFDVFIAQMEVENASFNVAINDTIYTLSQGRYDIGAIAENDLLQSELQLINARTDLAEARIDYERALQNLKLTLDLPYDADLEIVPPTRIDPVEVDPQEAVAHARRQRADLMAMDLELLQAEAELARARSENRFSAQLRASYGLNQQGTVLGDVYANPLNQQEVNLTLAMPIVQWGRGRAEREAARAALDRTERQADLVRKRLEQEVYFEALALMQLQQQVANAAKADTVAARRFEVARNRYTIGKIDITDLFDAQREKDQARNAYVQTLREYWTTLYRLRRLTLYDFHAERPLP